jgi:DNA processing protein
MIGPVRVRLLRTYFGNLKAAWEADRGELGKVLADLPTQKLMEVRSGFDPERELERILGLGISVIPSIDERYPRLLAKIPSPPPVLYVRGEMTIDDAIAVGIVGTRRASHHGKEVTDRIAGDLARANVAIVSGLALGIDGVAHQAALNAGGRTIAVLGSGVDVIYPLAHRKLADAIIESGAIVSDYYPGTRPDAPNFPPRNRIISGLSLGVVITEAPIKSGALITCSFAGDQGRDVMAVPGPALSENCAGSNRLLRNGATAVMSAEDVLEDLRLSDVNLSIPVQQPFPVTEPERKILALLTAQPQHIDEIAESARMSITEISPMLAMMELKGAVRNVGAQHYARG